MSSLMQTAKSCLIFACKTHQNPDDNSDLTRDRKTMQRFIDNSNGKPFTKPTCLKRECKAIKAPSAIVSGHTSIGGGPTRRLRHDLQSSSFLSSVRSTAGLATLPVISTVYGCQAALPAERCAFKLITDLYLYRSRK